MEVFWVLLLLLIVLFWAVRVAARGGLGLDCGATDYDERFAQLEQELRELQAVVDDHITNRQEQDEPAEEQAPETPEQASADNEE